MGKLSTLSPSQLRVLSFLKQTGGRSAKQIAEAMGIGATAARNHLAILEKAGLVSATPQRNKTGRPAHIHRLTKDANDYFPTDYANFAADLVSATIEVVGQARLLAILRRMQKKTNTRYAERVDRKNLAGRVAEVTSILDEAGYMAEWRKTGRNSYEIIERNCSILDVASGCPGVCDCELSMIRHLLGASVERQEHMIAGDSVCRYTIQTPISPAQKKTQSRRLSSRTA